MGPARDLLLSSLADSVLPFLRRSLEDVVYEILDRRRVPSRGDFEDLEQRHARLKAELARLTREVEGLKAAAAQGGAITP
jgi:hypothetical protein